MEALTVAVLPASVRPLLEGRLPDWLEPCWWDTPETLVELAPRAQIGWFDLHVKPPALHAIASARGLRWLNTSYTGVDWMPLKELAARGVRLTCGSGLTTHQVAEFAVMGMLAIAKDYPAVVRAQDRHEWLAAAPGTRDLAGSRALLLGYGAIGQAIGRALAGLGVDVAAVTSRGGAGALAPDAWRARLAEFDWIVLAVPGTPATRGMIGKAEFDVMKPEAVLVNFAPRRLRGPACADGGAAARAYRRGTARSDRSRAAGRPAIRCGRCPMRISRCTSRASGRRPARPARRSGSW